MPFTEAVLMETQRMQPIAPVIGPRRVLDDTTLGGYTIPKNTTVLINIYSITIDRELFSDPELFKPERHLNQKGAYRMDENVIPFGKGQLIMIYGEILEKKLNIQLCINYILQNLSVEIAMSISRYYHNALYFIITCFI